MNFTELKKFIEDSSAKIVVVGLGYVGLPTSALFARAGFDVTGTDINRELIEKINRGQCPAVEPGLLDLVVKAVKKGKLKADSDTVSAVEKANVAVIVVNTPIQGSDIDLMPLEEASKAVGKGLQKGTLVVIESTIPPKTTEDFVIPILEEQSNLKAGYDFWVAYSPEQAIPGKFLDEMRNQPRIIAGINPESTELAATLYKKIVDAKIVEVNNPAVAELAKILQNTYRDVNIALANEIALICEKLGIDVHEAIELANIHPRVHLHKPGAGVGGPCIPRDPLFLIEKAREVEVKPRLIELARQINEEMPDHVVRLTLEAFEESKRQIANAKIAVLGVAYKKDVNDVRASPAKPIIQGLLKHGAEVVVHDPYCNETFGGKPAKTLEEALDYAAAAIIVTDHSAYERINIDYLMEHMQNVTIVIDARGVLPSVSKPNLVFKRI
ncbi:MAG: nucleotide sugar dehydrogenase [Euryarchaeota archaeon]|nr:nucleotide sugar dehydrogenase [Euryarchaeota archaeon]